MNTQVDEKLSDKLSNVFMRFYQLIDDFNENQNHKEFLYHAAGNLSMHINQYISNIIYEYRNNKYINYDEYNYIKKYIPNLNFTQYSYILSKPKIVEQFEIYKDLDDLNDLVEGKDLLFNIINTFNDILDFKYDIITLNSYNQDLVNIYLNVNLIYLLSNISKDENNFYKKKYLSLITIKLKPNDYLNHFISVKDHYNNDNYYCRRKTYKDFKDVAEISKEIKRSIENAAIY